MKRFNAATHSRSILTGQNIRAHYDVKQACDTPFELTAENLTSPKLNNELMKV